MNSSAAKWAAIVLAGGLVLYFLAKKFASSVSNFNQGTPYQGAGVVGALGNVFDQASGGTLSDAGSVAGGTAFDILHPNAAGSSVFHLVTFPDGARHAIDANAVDGNGLFLYNGMTYELHLIGNSYSAVYAQ